MDGFRPESETVIHSWGVWSLVEARGIAPDGAAMSRTFVRSPGVVAVVAITETDGIVNIVLIHQYRAALASTAWELPAGMRDVIGESTTDAARRELREETGYTAQKLTALGELVQAPGITNSTVHLFLATGLTLGERNPQGPEETAMEVHVIPLATARTMVEHNEINNATAVVGILRASQLLL